MVAAIGLASAAVGAYGATSAAKTNRAAAEAASQQGSQNTTQTLALDPRMQSLLYGDGTAGNKGLLAQIAAQAGKPQSAGLAGLNSGIDSYLNNWGADSFNRSQQMAQSLQETNAATPNIEAARVKAPAQNGLDLKSAFDRTINGDAGKNPYLTSAIQGGINQSQNAFDQMQRKSTQNLQENVLPGIKSGSILSGGYGGSRQGIAEGRAIGDFAQGQQEAINQFGQNNTNAAVGAQAQAFGQGQDRSLSALMGLSGQQYGVASQNASMENAVNLANQQAYLQNNQNNTQARATGIGLSSGLLGQAYGYANNANNYDLTRLGQVSGAISPYGGLGSTTSTQGTSSGSQTTPYYSNQVGNAIGGATAGLGLFNSLKGSFGNYGSGNVGSNNDYAYNDWLTS